MLCHFGINRFHNQEQADGTKEPETFLLTAFDGRLWIEIAKADPVIEPIGVCKASLATLLSNKFVFTQT